MKIARNNLACYFKNVVISEVVGVNKPDQAIFAFALDAAKAEKCHCLMVGDSVEADIRGAMRFGIEAIYFNPLNKEKPEDVVHQILHFEQLMTIL